MTNIHAGRASFSRANHPTTVVMFPTRWAMSGYLDLNDGAFPSIVERDKVLSGASTRACGNVQRFHGEQTGSRL